MYGCFLQGTTSPHGTPAALCTLRQPNIFCLDLLAVRSCIIYVLGNTLSSMGPVGLT